MTLAESLSEYVRACFTGLWVRTHEPDDAVAEVAALCRREGWALATWDVDRGLALAGTSADAAPAGPAGPAAPAEPGAPTRPAGPGAPDAPPFGERSTMRVGAARRWAALGPGSRGGGGGPACWMYVGGGV